MLPEIEKGRQCMANPKKAAHRAATASRQSTSPVHEPEVVGAPISEEQQLVSSNLEPLTTFISGLMTFFRTAGQLEAAARDRLTDVQKFEGDLKVAGVTIPRDADEDAQAQVMIRASKLGRQKTDTFWSITSVLSKLHKATVAGRERAGSLDDEAAAIAQRLHNGYTDAETRRARLEEDRIRQERERVAREDRAREQQQAEEAALRAEMNAPSCSEREMQFVNFVTLDIYSGSSQGNPERSAERAGYKDPMTAGPKLMASAKIQSAIAAKQDAENIRRQAQAKREMPLDVQVEKVRPNIQRAAGSHDRVTWSADVFDADAFMAALLDPRQRMQLGIPADCATFNQVKLNEVARSIHEKMDVFPGVRAKKTTSTV